MNGGVFMLSGLGRVTEILASQLQIYTRLLEAAKNKRDQVIANRVDLLEQTLQEEIELLSQIEELEAERSVVMMSVCDALGIDPEEATLTLLAEKLPEDQSARLLELRDSILSTLDELSSLSQVNERLIRDSLRLINYSLGLYFPDDNDSIYDSGTSGGQLTKEKHKGLFDTKA